MQSQIITPLWHIIKRDGRKEFSKYDFKGILNRYNAEHAQVSYDPEDPQSFESMFSSPT